MARKELLVKTLRQHRGERAKRPSGVIAQWLAANYDAKKWRKQLIM